MLKRECTQLSYEIPVADLLKIMDHDSKLENNNDWDNHVSHLINRIEGVDNCDYNGHFGHYVFVEIAADFDNEATWAEIEKVLKEFI
jgi:hypothetical protein